MRNYQLTAQARRAVAKAERAVRKGWRPGRGPICSYGTKRRARRQEGES